MIWAAGKQGARRRAAIGAVLIACLACMVLCALMFPVRSAFADGSLLVTVKTAVSTQSTTWPDFRGSQTNNAITSAATPKTKADAGLVWATKFSDGYVSPEIIVNEEVIVTYGSNAKGKICKLNKKTGEVVAEANMRNSSTYSLMPPTYADGKIFVTLSGGSMEAFDAATLKSLWYYQNTDGGQGNCPVVYSDGRVYTGYWSGETSERSFVCVDASSGSLVWERTCAGGYYWAGALVVGDYLLFGCEDGKPASETGTSYVRCVKKDTGDDVSYVTVSGDQRSSIVYDPDLGRVYFTSKPGYLYSAALDEETGALSDLLSLKIDSETTATPLVYGGRVYVGSSSGSFSQGMLSVVDAESLELLYQLGGKAGIGGTVKSAPLVSTAYVGGSAGSVNGKLYLYLTVNNRPGGITMVSVEPNSTAASQATVTSLFTPPTSLQQYCIASVICDDEGNLYYRNDSNYLMCVGPGGIDPADYKDPSDESSDGDDSSGTSGKEKGKSSGKDGTSGKSGSKTHAESGQAFPGSGMQRHLGVQAGAASRTSRPAGVQASGTRDGAASKANPTAKGAVPQNKQDGSTRHTDTVASEQHLDDTLEQGTPEWLVSAIVAIVAAIALASAFAVRMIRGRRAIGGGRAVADTPDVAGTADEAPAEQADGSHER